MNTSSITVAILGSGRVAELLVDRIGARNDVRFGGSFAVADATPTGTECVIVLPTRAQLADGSAARDVRQLLRAGVDVITTAPPEAFGEAALLDACRAGGSTFHGTGGLQTRLISRFNRAFASISRNIEDVVFVEERGLLEDDGVDLADPRSVESFTRDWASHYDAGLRTLADAVFGTTPSAEPVTSSSVRLVRDDGPRRLGPSAEESNPSLVVRRSLGTRVSYDSRFTRRSGDDGTLRYELHTKTADAIGHVEITFHAEGGSLPAEHLACAGLLDAIEPTRSSAPGVLRHELAIDFVRPDPRFAR